MLFTKHLLKDTQQVWLLPLLLMLLLFVSDLFFQYYGVYFTHLFSLTPKIYCIEASVYIVLMTISGYWLSVRIINKSVDYLNQHLIIQKYPRLSIILPFFNTLLKALIFLILFNFLTQNLDLPDKVSFILNKLSSVMIICVIGWLLLKLIDSSEELLLHHFNAEVSGTYTERKVYTQTLILKRIAYSIVGILTMGAILILFENVRALGASVLTTAGVVGLILTFTAQRSLASIFSGLEIALTQPIKIGDAVVIDKEFGTIEEINFRNVIIKLWDWRRLIVPTSFFLDKTFENWSRVQDNNLIGTVYVYVDFILPVAMVREQLSVILAKSPYWDKKVGLLQVGDLQERVMQLKILASASNPNDLANLRAFIREEIISYIVTNYPNALPKTRSYTVKNDFDSENRLIQ